MPDTQTPNAPPSALQTEIARIKAAHADAILEVSERPERGMYWIRVKPRSIVPVLKLLRDDRATDFKLLHDLFAIDYPETRERFNVLYGLYSVSRNKRIFLRVHVAEGESIPSAVSVFPSAGYAEREVYDLFGVHFENHPDLRRILCPDDWQGHPLRKDYPLIGRRPVVLYNDVKDVL